MTRRLMIHSERSTGRASRPRGPSSVISVTPGIDALPVPASGRLTAPIFIIAVGTFQAALSWGTFAPGDFGLFYASARQWLSTGQFYPHPGYSPNANLPHVTALFAPLTLLSVFWARAAWELFNLTALAWIAWRLRLGVPAAALLTASQPFIAQTAQAQIAGVLAAVVGEAWLAETAGRRLAAGIWLGFAAACKPLLLPIVVWWVVRRAWLSAVASAAVVAGSFALGLLVLGSGAYQQWSNALSTLSEWAWWSLNASLWGAAVRSVDPEWQRAAWTIAATVIVLVTAVSTWNVPGERAWPALILACVLLSPLGWGYYGLLLIGPLSGTAWRWSLVGLWIPAAILPPAWNVGTLALLAAWAGQLPGRQIQAPKLERHSVES